MSSQIPGGSNTIGASGPMTVINRNDEPPVAGLFPWSAQIGSSTYEAPAINGNDEILYGICYDLTIPPGSNINFWAKKITNEPASSGTPLRGFQTAAILSQPPINSGPFPATTITYLYKTQDSSAVWKNYGYNLATSGNATLFFGIESPGSLSGSAGSLEQLIAGVAVAPQAVVPTQVSSTIYVTDRVAATIQEFPVNSGYIGPLSAAIIGSNTQLADPVTVAVDAAGNIYAANDEDSKILIFPVGSNGNAQPATLGGSNTGITDTGAVAIDHNGLIYVANHVSNSIVVFPYGSTGNMFPVHTIFGQQTGLSAPSGMTFDANNNLYVTGYTGVLEFSAGATGNVAPIASYIPNGDGAASESAIDSNGRIITGNTCAEEINIFTPAPGLNTVPAHTLFPGSPLLACSLSFAVDSSNNIYALSDAAYTGGPGQGSGISVFAPNIYGTATFAVSPFEQLLLPTLTVPTALAIH